MAEALHLFFGQHLVGLIEGAFSSDNTGFGTFIPTSDSGPDLERVRDYITFSVEWHERLRQGYSPDSSEFDSYLDIHTSELWLTKDEVGSVEQITGPVFTEGEVTWEPASNKSVA